MSDLSSPTGRKNLCKTYSTFLGGGRVRDFPTPGTLHSRLPPLFLDFLSPINPVSTPFGRGGEFRDVPTSRTLHFRLPLLFLGSLSPISLRRADVFSVVASLRRERSDDRKYVSASQAFAGNSPISPASTAKYSVSIWNKKCHFRKGTNFGNQTLTRKSKMKPKIRDFFKQRKQDKNQNKYSRLPITRTFKANRKKVRVIGSSSYREFEENSRQ